MKKFKIILILFLFINLLHAQNQAHNWYFGDHAGITFSTNPPTMLIGGQINTHEGCTSISDTNGNLLFYSDGVTVWDRTHSIMQNGTGLLGQNSSTQSGIIIPAPGNTTLFYLITAPVNLSNDPLAYSVIDMTLNSGYGAVTTKNVTLIDTSTEKVTAVYHQNGTDIWIIAHGFPNNNFYAFLLTATGINIIPVISSVGQPIVDAVHETGYLKASPCGNQLAMASLGFGAKFEIFNFDNSTGFISNALQIWTDTLSFSWLYGVEFSPDNSKLYASVSNPGFVVQYDLLAGSTAAIIASKTIVGYAIGNFGALQTGPDGRIYLINLFDSTLACITNPNQLGTLAGYVANYVSLGSGIAHYGLPAFLSTYFCNITSDLNAITPEFSISISPNPVSDKLNVIVNNKVLSEIILYDITSRKILHQSFTNSTSINTSHLSKGIYIYELSPVPFSSGNKNGVIKKGKVVKD